MTILGIDYGTKRVGIALSDASETLAFPETTLATSPSIANDVAVLCKDKGVRMVVLGKSQDLRGNDNPVMRDIEAFKRELETASGLPVMFQQEYWTSQEARRFQGRGGEIDASAAALILQRFLDILREQQT